jgi:hypothetical protein
MEDNRWTQQFKCNADTESFECRQTQSKHVFRWGQGRSPPLEPYQPYKNQFFFTTHSEKSCPDYIFFYIRDRPPPAIQTKYMYDSKSNLFGFTFTVAFLMVFIMHVRKQSYFCKQICILSRIKVQFPSDKRLVAH